MIEINGLEKIYYMGEHELHAVQHVSFKINRGDFVAIMGPSGSGKSTLMHILGLLDAPTKGSYKLLDREVSGLNESELARLRSRRIGFIFQQFNLLARTTAEDNVGLPLIYNTGHHDRERTFKLLGLVGLKDRTGHKPNELSGGQQQRVAIARSLVNAPDIIFADEPTGNLDSASEREIMNILCQLNAQGITVVIVTHENDIAKYVKRVIRMRDGKIESDEINPDFTPIKYVRDEYSVLEPPKDSDELSFSHFLSLFGVYGRQAIRALMANKLRTSLSMLGILIGVAAVIAMLALGTGAQSSIEAQLSSLGSNTLTIRPDRHRSGGVQLGAGSATRLTLADASAFSHVNGVVSSSPTVSGKAQVVYGNKNWNTTVMGANRQYEQVRSATPTSGRFFTDEEDLMRSRVALAGVAVARELFGDKSPLGETVRINRIGFTIIGVLPEKGASRFQDQDDIVIVPVNTAMKRLFGKDYVDSIDLQISDSSLADNITSEIETIIRKRHRIDDEQEVDVRIRNMAEIQEAMSQTSRVMSMLLAAIASISLLVGGIGIMNIMLVAVAERTKEIGLRKALGATKGSILFQFLVEAVVVSMTGGLIGVIFGWVIAMGMSVFAGWVVIVSTGSILLSLLFSGGIGIIFGIWPARVASKLQPIEALHHD